MESFAGRRVLVVGLGVSGSATARALLERKANVRVTEGDSTPAIRDRAETLKAAGAEIEIGGHDLSRLDADLAIVSPGIPPNAPILVALQEREIEVWSEIELAYRLADCDMLAVTGTNGKTTTTTLLAAMLAQSGRPSPPAGNIGLPLVEAIEEVPPGGAIAVEVSSFQLAGIRRFRPRAACILNVAEDHTDWHGSVEEYARAKARITENQTGDDVLVYNESDPIASKIAASATARTVPFSTLRAPEGGIGVDGEVIRWRGESVIATAGISLPGHAGLEDVVAAAGTALEYGLDAGTVAAAVRAFRPLRHRLEVVASRDDVDYIDDSKATNPHATLAAVRGSKDVVLIAGGRSKGMDLSSLRSSVPPVIAVVALGEAAEEVEETFAGLVPVERAASMEDAVRRARGRSVPGGSVLLSPGCASLDMYESYAERGDDFARAVRELLDGNGSERRGH